MKINGIKIDLGGQDGGAIRKLMELKGLEIDGDEEKKERMGLGDEGHPPCFSYVWQGKKLRAKIADVWQGKDLRGLTGISCDIIPFGYCLSRSILGKRLKDNAETLSTPRFAEKERVKDNAPFEAQVEKSRSLDFARDDNLKETLSTLRFAEKERVTDNAPFEAQGREKQVPRLRSG